MGDFGQALFLTAGGGVSWTGRKDQNSRWPLVNCFFLGASGDWARAKLIKRTGMRSFGATDGHDSAWSGLPAGYAGVHAGISRECPLESRHSRPKACSTVSALVPFE